MSKLLLLNICLLLVNFVNAQDTTAILAKAEVKKATEEEMKRDKERVLDIISSPENVKKHFNHFVLVGPELWAVIKEFDQFKRIPEGNLVLKVPKFEANGTWKTTKEVTGKVLQKEEDFQTLFTWLNNNFTLNHAAIVNRNNADDFLYWLYFAKIEEPIITVQNKITRLMFKFVDQGLFFIEISNKPVCILMEEE